MKNTNIGVGIENNSVMFFSSLTQKPSLYFYALSAGHFYCNKDYIVSRDNFDSILVQFVVNGTFSFLMNGEEQTAEAYQVALVDCYNPHTYYTNTNCEAYWVHLGGSNIWEIYKEIVNRHGAVISADEKTDRQIKELYELIKFGTNINESQMSLKIYRLLIHMLNSDIRTNENNIINDAITFIFENYQNKLSVEDAARAVHLSVSQFSRKFKAQTGISPYDYILNLRLTKAKELLKNTNLTVSEIAGSIGFFSDSNFIYFFKQNEGISPLKFRKTVF